MPYTSLASVQLSIWNVLKEHGKNPEAIFQEAELDPSLMLQAGSRYSRDKVDILWQKTSIAIDDPCFGLSIASHWHPSSYGALGYAMLSSPSLRSMFQRIDRYAAALSTDGFFHLREHNNEMEIILTHDGTSEYIAAQEDGALAMIVSHCRLNYQQDLTPVHVKITHPAPVCSGRYFEYFKSPVKFNSRVASVTFSIETMDEILPGRDEHLAELTDQAIVSYLATVKEENIITQVEKILLQHLPGGNATNTLIAGELFLSPRTLQRKLQAKKTTFKNILDRVRLNVAREHIKDDNTSMIEIAFLLGFSESSAFSRAFKRWSGMSPTEYRNAHLLES